MASGEEKQRKRDARVLRDEAKAAFSAGDFSTARKLDRELAEKYPDLDLGREARLEAEKLTVDPVGIYCGLGAVALYLLAWGVSLA